MIRKTLLFIVLIVAVSSAFAQQQVPLFTPVNGGGIMSGSNLMVSSVIGQNAIGITSGSNQKVYLGIMAPVALNLTHIGMLKKGSVKLFQNYPNPFITKTIISYELEKPEKVVLTLYDVLGQAKEILVDQAMPAGLHYFTLTAKDLNPGMYFYRLKVDDYFITKPMILKE